MASLATRGRYFFFWSSFPNRRIGMAMPMDCGTATVNARMLLQLAMSVSTRP